jgi:hypothetical protein
MVRIAVFITAVLIAVAPLSAEAGKERNQRQNLDPRMNAKVQNFKAQAWRESTGQQAKGKTGPQAGCGSQSVGVVQTPKNGTAPREVNTIVTGDVINIVGPNGCR